MNYSRNQLVIALMIYTFCLIFIVVLVAFAVTTVDINWTVWWVTMGMCLVGVGFSVWQYEEIDKILLEYDKKMKKKLDKASLI